MKIVIPYYIGSKRIDRAINSWSPEDVVLALTDTYESDNEVLRKYNHFFTNKCARSEGIGTTTKPYIIDLLNNLVSMYPDEDYYGFFNADIILPPGTLATDLITEYKTVIVHHRSEVEGDDDSPIADLTRGGYIVVGKDGFIFHRNVISTVLNGFTDMIIGAPQWDTALALWIREHFPDEEVSLRYGDIWHVSHKSSIDDKEMYNTNEARTNRLILDNMSLGKKRMTQLEWLEICNAHRMNVKDLEGAIGIVQPGRTGDIIICLPIAKWYYDKGYKVFWPVQKQFLPLFEYIPYVEAVETEDYYTAKQYLEQHSKVEKIIDLGIGFGRDEQDWYDSGLSFDEWKYKEANVPFSEKYNLIINRNKLREEQLFRVLKLDEYHGYVVTHSTTDSVRSSYNFCVPEAVEVRPIPNYTVFDWLTVLERAELILCVDSCIANLINQLGIGVDKRYFKSWDKIYGSFLNTYRRTPRLSYGWKNFTGIEYKGIVYPDYLNDNNAMQHIVEYAKNFCKGRGVDLGGGQNQYPGSINLDVKEGQDIEAIDNYGSNLDYIFSSHFLEHTDDPHKVLEKCYTSLREGGTLFLYLPHPDMLYWRPSNPYMQGRYGHKHVLIPSEVFRSLIDIGFSIEVKTNSPDYYYSYYVVAKR